MSEAPKPSSWPSSFVSACISIFIGSIALYLAVTIIRSIASVLIVLAVITLIAWAVWAWRHRPPRAW